jgi:hypothetical protein
MIPMFGKMNIEKATKFFLTEPRIINLKAQLKPDQNLLATMWNQYEKNVYTLFKRKYRLELSIEQRWHITLAVFESCPYPLDFSLNEFLKRGVSEIGIWSVRARSRYIIELNAPEALSADEILSGFPFFPLFIYSLNNHEVIYPNNELAKSVVMHLQKVDSLEGRKAIDDWYSNCRKFIDPAS